MTEPPESDSAQQVLGVDLGGSKTALIAGDALGRVLGRIEYPTLPERGYLDWLSRFRSGYRNLQSVTAGWAPEAAGVSVGGPADWNAGILLSPPNLPGWDRVPVRVDIAGVTGMPGRMEHDGRAGAMAEHEFGAGRGVANLVFLTFGTGIGAGIVIQNQVYRGASGSAGEAGHVRVAESGPEAYGKRGSLESFACGTGIARLASQMFPSVWSRAPDAREVTLLAERGDRNARSVLRESAEMLGRGLAVLIDVLNPEMIVLGSLAGRLPGWYLETALEAAREEALPDNYRACNIVPSGLGESLQDVAALLAAVRGI